MRTTGNETSSSRSIWAGRILGGVPAVFLLLNGVMTLFRPPMVVEGTAKMGYPESSIIGLGLSMLIGACLYLYPRTAVLGAILLTGYLGGAVATHVRVGDPWVNILFPAFFGALLWGGLWFRDARVRKLLPFDNA